MFLGVGVEVLDDVVAFSFQEVLIVLVMQEISDLFTTDEPTALSIDPAERCIWLESLETAQIESLFLDLFLFFSDCEQERGKFDPHDRCKSLEIVFFVVVSFYTLLIPAVTIFFPWEIPVIVTGVC